MCVGRQGPDELPVEGSLRGVNSACLSSAQNSSGAPTTLRIETSAQWPASLCSALLTTPPPATAGPDAGFSFLANGPPLLSFHMSWLPPPQGLCTRSSLCLKLFFHALHHLMLTHLCNLSSDLIFLRKAFPRRPPPLLCLSPLLNHRLWVIYLQHIFLPELGRKRGCVVLHPQEERALPAGWQDCVPRALLT